MHKQDIFPFGDDLWASDSGDIPCRRAFRVPALPSPPARLSSQPRAQPQILPKGVQGSAGVPARQWLSLGRLIQGEVPKAGPELKLSGTSVIWFFYQHQLPHLSLCRGKSCLCNTKWLMAPLSFTVKRSREPVWRVGVTCRPTLPGMPGGPGGPGLPWERKNN